MKNDFYWILNIISEMMKASPSSHVTHWLNSHDAASPLYLTTITIAEISYGIHILPKGKKRQQLEAAFDQAIATAFYQRILKFDEPAAPIYGKLMAKHKELGRPMSIADAQIAAIAYSQDLKLATRNIKDFKNCDLTLIDPFQ